MSKVETRSFKMHSRLLFDVIQRQAGTLSKAVLEGVMNMADAGAAKGSISLTDTELQLSDNGTGFKSRDDIIKFFEIFGQPHEESEHKKFGTFRMGRGQLFAFGINRWRTTSFGMDVDIKNQGLDYTLFQDKSKRVKGCNISVQLYDPLLPSSLAETEDDIKRWCKWMPIDLTFNGQKISHDPRCGMWTEITDDAYIKLDESQTLTIYNLGAYVRDYPKYQFGVGGEIVTKNQLSVNFARNDIQSTCPVWKNIKPLIDERATNANLKKKSLDDGARARLSRQIAANAIAPHQALSLKVLTAVTGRHYSWKDIKWYRCRDRISVAVKGSRLGDKLHRQGVAFVLASEVLTRFGVSTIDELIQIFKKYAGGNGPTFIPFERLTEGMVDKYEIIDQKDWTQNEQTWLSLLADTSGVLAARDGCDSFGSSRRRKILIGIADGASAWTDGNSYIAINRNYLKTHELDLKGFIEVSTVLLHEYCHHDLDTVDHDHDQEFYELFHDSSAIFQRNFIMHCIRNLPKILAAQNRKLTKKQLREKDVFVTGQRRTEELQQTIAQHAIAAG